MKLLAVIALGLAPLAVCTASLLKEALGTPPAATASLAASTDGAEALELARDIDRRCALLDDATGDLAGLDPLGAAPLNAASVRTGLNAGWTKALAQTADLKAAHDFNRKVIEGLGGRKLGTSPIAPLKTLRAGLDESLKARKSPQELAGTAKILAKLDEEIAARERTDRLATTIQSVRDDLERAVDESLRRNGPAADGVFPPLLKRLDALSDDLARAAARQADVDELRRRVLFFRHWNPPFSLRLTSTDLDTASERKRSLERLTTTSAPEPTTDDERERKGAIEAALAGLSKDVAWLEFKAGPPDRPDEYLRQLSTVAAQVQGDRTRRDALKKLLGEWVVRQLPEKRFERVNPQLGEVRGRDGTYLLGRFEASKGNVYKFYEWSFTKKGFATVYKEKFENPDFAEDDRTPRPPREYLLAEAFNRERNGVVTKLGEQKDWTEFSKKCDRWKNELTTYRGIQKDRLLLPDLSFDADVDFVTTLLDHWDAVERLYH